MDFANNIGDFFGFRQFYYYGNKSQTVSLDDSWWRIKNPSYSVRTMVERVKLLSIERSLPTDSWSELANDVYEDYMDDFQQTSKVIWDIFGDMSNIVQATGKQHRPPGYPRQWAHGLCTNTSLAFLVQVCGLGSRSEWCFHHRYLGGFERYDEAPVTSKLLDMVLFKFLCCVLCVFNGSFIYNICTFLYWLNLFDCLVSFVAFPCWHSD